MRAQASAGSPVVTRTDDGDRLDAQSPQGPEGHREPVAATEGHDGHGHSRPRSRCTTTDSMSCAPKRAATSSAKATLRCFPPVQPTATVT